MRQLLLALPLLLGQVPAAQAQVSVGIGISVPGVSIGINMPAYPQLVRVPGYPVYYAPSVSWNYFFYDGLYWVFVDDNWYASDWYNGPWALVAPVYVPVFVLRVPVHYYIRPPVYFGDWRADAPPRWGEHWGRDWQHQRRGWDRWDRHRVPAAAPLPVYQRHYAGERYPQAPEQQRALRAANYRYQPREAVSKQQYQRPVAPVAPIARERSEPRQERAAPQRPVPPRESQRPDQPRPQVQPLRPPPPPQPDQARPRERPVQVPPPQRAQPEHPRPQAPQLEPQVRGQVQGQGNRGEPQERGREAKGGPPQDRGRDKKND